MRLRAMTGTLVCGCGVEGERAWRGVKWESGVGVGKQKWAALSKTTLAPDNRPQRRCGVSLREGTSSPRPHRNNEPFFEKWVQSKELKG